jgi:hypothetical protein
MAGLTLSAIREALAAQLKLNIARDVNVRAYPPMSGTGPAILIDLDPDAVDYWMTMGAAGVSTVRLTLKVDPALGGDMESAARRLDEMLSAGVGNGSSIVDAVMADRTLGLAGVTCLPRSVTVDPESLTFVMGVEVTVSKSGAKA